MTPHAERAESLIVEWRYKYNLIEGDVDWLRLKLIDAMSGVEKEAQTETIQCCKSKVKSVLAAFGLSNGVIENSIILAFDRLCAPPSPFGCECWESDGDMFVCYKIQANVGAGLLHRMLHCPACGKERQKR